MEFTQFERLEEKIQELIETCTAAKRKNEELLEIIAQKDQDIDRLNKELAAAAQDREHIGERVHKLLDKIEGLGTI